MNNALWHVKALGQSVWYDTIDRAQLRSGQFQRLINEDGISGATANPTIFQHSISSGHAYDEQMNQLISQGKRTGEIYEALVISDVCAVADLLRPMYESTNGQDGFVSLEVSPDLAHDAQGTLAEVRRFWQMVNRPNLMVKIPATPAGLPTIRQSLAEGININITLIFSLANYREVVDAYLSALEERLAAGNALDRIASVASFFVSRVDVLVDQLLADTIEGVRESSRQEQLKALRGKAAIANARLVYQEFQRLFRTPRFEALERNGARVQRPLWASTSTKNPAYRDVLYAEELIGPDTIDTMPLQTIERFRDHGSVRLSIADDVQEAQAVLAALAAVGISYEQITQQLQEEGVRKFADSFHQLFAGIEDRQRVMREKEHTQK